MGHKNAHRWLLTLIKSYLRPIFLSLDLPRGSYLFPSMLHLRPLLFCHLIIVLFILKYSRHLLFSLFFKLSKEMFLYNFSQPAVTFTMNLFSHWNQNLPLHDLKAFMTPRTASKENLMQPIFLIAKFCMGWWFLFFHSFHRPSDL